MLSTIEKIASVMLVAVVGIAGCSKSADQSETAGEVVEDGHALHGWWCTEHGVPEDQCALCNATLAADFKAKGDWCDEHDRPESQCFICFPEREAEFAALFEAKYGEAPPKPQAGEGHDHEGHDHDHPES
jgi:cobalt-zinc-cadmium efflux system membrane fusion protein